MPAETRCPSCGAEHPGRAPDGLCPRCLIGNVLGSTGSGLAGAGQATTATHDTAAGDCVLDTLAGTLGPVPRVLLRDTEPATGPGPVVKPSSPDMPRLADRPARLQLLGEIARGGMGAVLKGRDVDLGRDLAIKVLLEQHRDNAELTRRFVEEAQIAGQLQHPGVAPVYELGAFGDRRPYFAMKLVKGRTLAAVLADRRDPAEGRMDLLGTLLRVAQTVAYAHARGVIHRDLKPSNVMVGGFGEVLVMDWGLAKVLPEGGAADDAGAGRNKDQETVIATARSGSGSDLSRAGSVMGTPAYMAPEQARGEVGAVDQRADVFALGSMLCEMLTGQPAFTGRTSAEIQRRAARGELAGAFGRLGACGADAELIALAESCLAGERDDRHRDASAVVDRLDTYLRSIEQRLRAAELERVAEAARAEEAGARVAVERSRRRRTVALAASLLALLTLGGLAVSYVRQQAQTRLAAADQALAEVTTLLGQARARPDDPTLWQAALGATRRINAAALIPAARARLDTLARNIEEGIAAERADRELLGRLLDIRSAAADDPDGSATDAAYADAFRSAGLDPDQGDPAEVGARIARRPAAVARALVAALDHWTDVRRNTRSQGWTKLVAATRSADPDPDRDALRASMSIDDRAARLAHLRSLARRAGAESWAPASLVLLSNELAGRGAVEAGVAILRRGSGSYPTDAWIHYTLGRLLERIRPPRPDEVIEAYSIARALQPEMAHDLAHALDKVNRYNDAEAIFSDLIRRRPGNWQHLACGGRFLKERGRVAEATALLNRAIDAAHQRIAIEPNDPSAHSYLGLALHEEGKLEEAIRALREAIRLKPESAFARGLLGRALTDRGDLAKAIAELSEAARLLPNYAVIHYYLGSALAQRQRTREAVTELQKAIELEPDVAVSHHVLGTVLFQQGKLEEGIEQLRAAIRLKPDVAESHCNLGEALKRKGEFVESLAEYRKGQELGSKRPDWKYPSADWVRKAEHLAALAGRLPAILSSDDRPKDNAERLGLALVCYHTKRFVAAARFGAEALEADPALGQDRRALARYNAACAATLAAAGKGKDDPPPDDAAKARLRKQALTWMKAELEVWSSVLSRQDAPAQMRTQALSALGWWKQDPDMLSVRDPKSLVALSEPERAQWQSFWSEIDRRLAGAGTAP